MIDLRSLRAACPLGNKCICARRLEMGEDLPIGFEIDFFEETPDVLVGLTVVMHMNTDAAPLPTALAAAQHRARQEQVDALAALAADPRSPLVVLSEPTVSEPA